MERWIMYSTHTIALISLAVQVLWAIGLIVSGLVLSTLRGSASVFALFWPRFFHLFFTRFQMPRVAVV
jgi:hypothetical protein